MAYSIKVKNRAEKLRKDGYSYNEISDKMGISKGTLSRWFKDLKLSDKAKKRLLGKLRKGQMVAAEAKRERRRQKEKRAIEDARRIIQDCSLGDNIKILLCAMIYKCEGENSSDDRIGFSNSDPLLVKKFLELFREIFDVREDKFRVVLHLHGYHDVKELKNFWSTVTKIPLDQFSKVYQKGNSGPRTREGYKGCAQVRYFDKNKVRKMKAIASAFLEE